MVNALHTGRGAVKDSQNDCLDHRLRLYSLATHELNLIVSCPQTEEDPVV